MLRTVYLQGFGKALAELCAFRRFLSLPHFAQIAMASL